MEWLESLGSVAKDFSSIAALLALLIKPVREWLFGSASIREGQKCLLRSEIVRTYYRHLESKELRQYEYENLVHCYNAYKALGGNSFVEHIWSEMQEWTILP